jgi:hypothetical protein
MTASEATPAAAQDGLPRRAAPWLVLFALVGVALVVLYPDSYQQDGGFHYLFARWSLVHRQFLVDVWGRPLFTALYALPALAGYPVAKLLTVVLCLVTAWNGARLAEAHGLARAELAVPLLFLQPSFLLLCGETMTEPLFALVLVVALRLHRAGRPGAAMWVAGLLPLVRPEGFFVGVLWGAVALLDRGAGAGVVRRGLGTLRLAAGTAAWWLASWLITRDPLFIRKNWPSNWGVSYTYGTGSLWQYVRIHRELLAGPMVALFLLGVVVLLRARRAALALAAMVLVAGLHSVFFHYGLFGSAGYARYLVCVSVPMALACLAGWNAVAGWMARLPRALRLAAAAAALLWAGVHAIVYVDAFGPSRDAWAVAEMYDWFQAHPRPVKKLIFSQAYMSILFGRDPSERLLLGEDPEKNVKLLAGAPAGTLVFWDACTGPQFHHTGPAELERAGFELLHRQEFDLRPRLPVAPRSVQHHRQEMYLYYKP